ncbi:MAG: YggS family pyridoxal phosphate-dependent enzyme [Prevotellaceae bacterium]|nr:YggS family pyridoxal phosphate-dependent enzyme [Prevotellaceae bacterium]
MQNIRKNLQEVCTALPEGTRLVAVSKFHPAECIQTAYDSGQRIFGESREQELQEKVKILPEDIQWHFIGHLQTNKVRFIAPYITMIEAVDSLRLLREINKEAEKCNRVIDVLLELHIAQEATKYGLTTADCRQLLNDGEWRNMKNVRICGLMMMASFTNNTDQIHNEFMQAADFFNEIKKDFFADADYFCERSWGMSNDYEIAVQCRSTMVRVGSKIFGERVY